MQSISMSKFIQISLIFAMLESFIYNPYKGHSIFQVSLLTSETHLKVKQNQL